MTPEQFRKTRLKLKLTQAELALKLQVSRRTIIAFEKGEAKINPRTEFSMQWLVQNS